MPLIPAFMRKRHMDRYEFKGSVVYIVNSRSVSYIDPGEMAPWLISLTTLLEDPGSVPSTHMHLTAVYNSKIQHPHTDIQTCKIPAYIK